MSPEQQRLHDEWRRTIDRYAAVADELDRVNREVRADLVFLAHVVFVGSVIGLVIMALGHFVTRSW